LNTPKNPAVVADDVVVSLDYKLTVDSEVVDSSEKDDPIEFLQGRGQIIPGLEKALYGMKIGDEKTVTILPADGYGDIEKDAYIQISRAEFPQDIPAQVGISIQMQDEHGDILDARIFEITADTITLDFNHPLAGKTLHFDVSVVDLREATSEELEHGHVHGSDFEEDDDEFEDDEFDDDDDEFEDDEFDDEEEALDDEDDAEQKDNHH
jgi:FKBP-type peptidyl-prolyl cis-trans isomerase SlyD